MWVVVAFVVIVIVLCCRFSVCVCVCVCVCVSVCACISVLVCVGGRVCIFVRARVRERVWVVLFNDITLLLHQHGKTIRASGESCMMSLKCLESTHFRPRH